MSNGSWARAPQGYLGLALHRRRLNSRAHWARGARCAARPGHQRAPQSQQSMNFSAAPPCRVRALQNTRYRPTCKWTHWNLGPRFSACEADVMHSLIYTAAFRARALHFSVVPNDPGAQLPTPRFRGRQRGCASAETRDRAGDLQIFSVTLSQLSYRGR